ncbi:MAG: Uncharacterized protein Athens101410_107 [Parcubacteria group bacterium Athens1014_10]|nr:MAG: Uncharacterized protein Athens101410_107 [Parcubacteria group bacterium Athens1014_10]TSD05924.1 MAG: Uncharacterized protein Athens071412_206 [Parcubacteria group bacterium Athens0714_12]
MVWREQKFNPKNKSSKHSGKTKVIASVVLIFFILQVIIPVLFYPKPANAQWVVTDPIQTVMNMSKWVWERIEKAGEFLYNKVAAIAFKNALKTFTTKIAYDTAVWIGSGDKGQKPLLFTKNWKTYLEDAADAAAGDFLETLVSSGSGYCKGNSTARCGKNNFCSPIGTHCQCNNPNDPADCRWLSDINGAEISPCPKTDEGLYKQISDVCVSQWNINICEPSDISAKLKIQLGLGEEIKPREVKCTWKEMRNNWQKALKDPNFLRRFAVSFEPTQNDIGTYLTLSSQMLSVQQKAQTNAELKRAGNWVKDVTSPISEQIETPADLSQEQVKNSIKGADAPEKTFTGEIWADTISIFTNTLTARLTDRMKKGFWSLMDLGDDEDYNRFGSGLSAGGITKARNVFSSLAVPDIRSGGEYNPLSKFVSCPEDTRFASIDNCAIDENFAHAIREKLTVREAIEQGYIKGDWLLISPEEIAKNQDAYCYTYAYCHSNLVKLRKVRILPLGWEIAASISKGEATLKQMMDNFDNPDSKYFHLIDPEWLLKAPLTQCKSLVSGTFLESNESNRRQDVCVDTPSCISEDKNGNCRGGWGYCLREKNVWRLGGDECPFYFDTCSTYRREDGKVFSYLTNTLERNGCDADNAGCKWYSQSMLNEQWNVNDRIYLNKNAKKCDEKESGCEEFLYLSKITENRSLADVFNIVQADADENDIYENYAEVEKIYLNGNRTYCNANDLGCRLYTPVSRQGEPDIPGVIMDYNKCPAECVGYRYYKQSPTFFDTGNDLTALIAKNAKKCSAQNAGCEEFTNLDVVAQGGEGKEYYTYLRQCQKPNLSCANFYTWVGSEQTGYQLEVYNLESVAGGVPATVDNSGSCCDPNLVSDDPNSCSQKILTNPDCREFYNTNGEIFYRSYSKTITCSDDCHPLRKTDSNLQDCDATGGTWQNNNCIYMAIPSQGVKCSRQSAGCREYKGASANNYRVLFKNDFEDLTNQSWQGGVNSNESVNISGHSLRVNGAVSKSISPLPGRSYVLSFWAKGEGQLLSELRRPDLSLEFGRVNLISNEWNSYTVGPISFDAEENGGESIVINGQGVFYLDNIILKEIFDSLYLIKNSADTPAVCDQPITKAQINCEEYKDKKGNRYYLKSFSRLCEEDKAGCELLIDTRNSSSPYEESFNQGGDNIDDVTVQSDALVYVVVNSKNYCHSDDKGCRVFGLPSLDANGNLKLDSSNGQIWQTVYLKNNPDQYISTPEKIISPILCQNSEDKCEAYEANGATAYFKDPGERVCEFKENINLNGVITSGWFTKVNNLNCDIDEDRYPDIGWAGLCPSKYSGCTQFRPYQENTENLTGETYYYMDNNKLSFCSKEDWKDSCVKLEKMGINFNGQAREGEDNLLKVLRDRECGQWLTCENTHMVFDSRIGKYKEVCEDGGLILCDQSLGFGRGFSCSNEVNDPNLLQPLTQDVYASLNTGQWEALDFSGYSLFDKYQIHLLSSINFGSLDNPENKLVYILGDCPSGSANGSACNIGGRNGLCYSQRCVAGIDGNLPNGGALSSSCRGYPQKESPFSNNTRVITEFANANYCQDAGDGEVEACDCHYQKVSYGSGEEKYFAGNNLTIPDSICQGGEEDGKFCGQEVTVQDCRDGDGHCAPVKKKVNYIGWEGYCLERDKSKTINGKSDQFACLTWMPIDLIVGASDLYNQYVEAGFNAGGLGLGEGPFYCLEKEELNYDWRASYHEDSGECDGCPFGFVERNTRTYRRGLHDRCEWDCEVIGGNGCYISATLTIIPNLSQGDCNILSTGERCAEIAGVTQGAENKAWTDRVWQTSNFTNSLGYNYSSTCSPLFAALPNRAVDRETIFIDHENFPKCSQQEMFYIGDNDYQNNKSSLHDIFARSYQIYQYNIGNGYVPVNNSDVWDVTFTASNASRAPQISALKIRSVGVLDCDPSSGKCYQDANYRMTINNQNSGDILARGRIRTSLKFFSLVDKDQMPIRNIIINWGDGSASGPFPGFYKNHLAIGECDSRDFGHTPEACLEGYFNYYHSYRCEIGGAGWQAVCPVLGITNGGCCVFRPAIQIQDNWGWCNNGGYQAGCGGQMFDGRIVVIP